MSAPANWYPDPQNPSTLRYWDGEQWTEHVHARSIQEAPSPAVGQDNYIHDDFVANLMSAVEEPEEAANPFPASPNPTPPGVVAIPPGVEPQNAPSTPPNDAATPSVEIPPMASAPIASNNVNEVALPPSAEATPSWDSEERKAERAKDRKKFWRFTYGGIAATLVILLGIPLTISALTYDSRNNTGFIGHTFWIMFLIFCLPVILFFILKGGFTLLTGGKEQPNQRPSYLVGGRGYGSSSCGDIMGDLNVATIDDKKHAAQVLLQRSRTDHCKVCTSSGAAKFISVWAYK